MSDIDVDDLPSLNEYDSLKRVGKYVIQKKLGAGGMGTVFLALDDELNRPVALKVLPREKAENPVLVKRFKAEALSAAQLHHRNIVGVYEAGQADGLLYIALEYINGTDALELLRSRGVIPVKRSIEIIRGVAQALQHAAERNIVHRDIKPSNIMIAKDGEIKLADMGLARSIDAEADTGITRAGTTVGTVDYMAPEQARNSKAADIRSDLYSLGCTWYHLITGQPPFGEGDMVAKVHAHAVKPPPDPRRLNDRIPEAVVAVIQRLMSKKPLERHQTAQELIDDLANPNLHRQGVTNDVLASLRHEHVPETIDEDAAEDEPRPASSPSASRPGKSRSGPAARAAEPESGSGKSKSSSAKSRPKSPSASRSAAGAAAAFEDIDEDEEVGTKKSNRRKTGGDRSLPERMDAPKETGGGFSQISIDPIFFQIGLVALLIVAVVGTVTWYVRSMKTDNIDDQGNLAAALQRKELNAAPEAPKVQPNTAPAPMPEPEKVVEPPKAPDLKLTGPKDDTPFPGVPEVQLSNRTIYPAWTPYTRGSAPDDVPVVKVRRFKTGSGEIASLAALGNKDRVVIEFQDEGPHRIPVGTLSSLKWLGLRGKDVRPIVVLVGSVAEGKGALGSNRGVVKLEGVDLFWNAPEGTAGAAIAMQGGELLLRNSTLTVSGTPTALLALKGQAGMTSRTVLENVVLRGDAGEAIRIDGPGVELIGGNVACLTPGDSLTVNAAERVPPPQPPGDRVIRLFNSTFVTGGRFLSARHDGTKPPAALDVRLDHTVAALAGEPKSPASAIRVSNWPDSPADAADDPRPVAFKLAGDTFRLAGWKVLTEPASGNAVTDATSWRLYWMQAPPSETFLPSPPETFQKLLPRHSAESQATLAAAITWSERDVADQVIGAKFDTLPHPTEGLAEHVEAFANRPTIAALPAGGPETRFDLKKSQTLARFLSSEVPDGARVVLFGAGVKFLEPVALKKKTLTIVFEQTEGAPLELQPQSKSGNEKEGPEAWITLSDGAKVEIVGGRFNVLHSRGKQHPKSFARVNGSTLILSRCDIEGSQSAEAPGLPLVGAAGAGDSRILVRESFVRGKGPAVLLGAPKSTVVVQQSLLLAPGNAIELVQDVAGSTLSLDAATIAAGTSAIRLAADLKGDARIFSADSLFVPPTAEAGILVQDDAGAAGKSITWWGRANAYSGRLKGFLASPQVPASADFEQTWTKVWGAGRDLRPASGLEAVVLASPLGKLADLVPEDFHLNPTCLAAGWSESGDAAGADPKKVGVPVTAVAAAPNGSSKTSPANPPAKKPTSGF